MGTEWRDDDEPRPMQDQYEWLDTWRVWALIGIACAPCIVAAIVAVFD